MNLSHSDRPNNPDLSRWAALPLEEKKRQFIELMGSPYWRVLPEHIKARIRWIVHPTPTSHEGPENPCL